MTSQIVLTITGPSNAGKTVLSNMLVEQGYEALVSTTTRAPRKGEIDGKDYHFIDKETFKQMHETGQLIEDVNYDGNFYGVTEKEAMRAFEKGKPAVLVAEPNGSQQIYDLCTKRGWDVVKIFVNNPIDLLIDRMLRRFYDDVQHLDRLNPDEDVLLEKKFKAHGVRLHKVLTQEQKEWVQPAYNGSVKYDLIIDEFNSENTKEVLKSVVDLISARQNHALAMEHLNPSKVLKKNPRP